MLLRVPEPPPLVLIATLNAPARIALARLVTRRGMTALACFDGAATLAVAHAQRQEVWGAILDPDLPSIDGEGVARALREEASVVETFVLGGPDGGSRPADRAQDGFGLSPDELARVDAWLQRITPAQAAASGPSHAITRVPRCDR